MFRYGMLYRGFSPACQPMKGLIERQDDTSGKYFDILVYDRKLTENEVKNYELEEITMAEEKKKDRSEYMRQYYQKHREEMIERRKQWTKDHRDQHNESMREYRARKKKAANPGDILDALDAIKPESE